MKVEWRFLGVVRGYHVHKDVWDPYLVDGFTTKHERNDPHDKYAMVLLSVSGCKEQKNSGTVSERGSKESFLFILDGGTCTISLWQSTGRTATA